MDSIYRIDRYLKPANDDIPETINERVEGGQTEGDGNEIPEEGHQLDEAIQNRPQAVDEETEGGHRIRDGPWIDRNSPSIQLTKSSNEMTTTLVR